MRNFVTFCNDPRSPLEAKAIVPPRIQWYVASANFAQWARQQQFEKLHRAASWRSKFSMTVTTDSHQTYLWYPLTMFDILWYTVDIRMFVCVGGLQWSTYLLMNDHKFHVRALRSFSGPFGHDFLRHIRLFSHRIFSGCVLPASSAVVKTFCNSCRRWLASRCFKRRLHQSASVSIT